MLKGFVCIPMHKSTSSSRLSLLLSSSSPRVIIVSSSLVDIVLGVSNGVLSDIVVVVMGGEGEGEKNREKEGEKGEGKGEGKEKEKAIIFPFSTVVEMGEKNLSYSVVKRGKEREKEKEKEKERKRKEHEKKEEEEEEEEDEIVKLLPSSGSTGVPKLIVVTEKMIAGVAKVGIPFLFSPFVLLFYRVTLFYINF